MSCISKGTNIKERILSYAEEYLEGKRKMSDKQNNQMFYINVGPQNIKRASYKKVAYHKITWFKD